MKKIIFVIVAVLASVTVFAQRGIPRSNNLSVSSTVVTKRTMLSESKIRFQQMAELQMGLSFFSDDFLIGGSYSGGCRFSNWFYLGAEVGYYYEHMDGKWIPMYIHARGYFSKKSLKPYASLSLGMMYHYGQTYYKYENYFHIGGEFTIGLEIPVYKKLNLTAGVGISQMGVPIKIGLSF